MYIRQNIRHWLKIVLQWLGGQIWQMLVLTFWLLIQILELLIWVISEIKTRVKSGLITLRKEWKQQKIKIFLWPLQGLFRAVWEVIVQVGWLLVQVIALIFWLVQLWQKSRTNNSQKTARRSANRDD